MKSRTVIALIALALAATSPLAAFAVGGSNATSTPITAVAPRSSVPSAPVAIPSLEVQVWPSGEPSKTVMIVSASVPDSVKLPVTIKVPVPNGAEVVWAGEVLGGDPAADPYRKTQMVQAAGGRYVRFELSQSHTAQMELTGFPPVVNGDRVVAKVEWLQTAEASQTGFSVRLPAAVTDVKISPTPEGKPQSNETAESLYALPTKVLKVGQKQAITIDYSTGIVNPGSPTNTPNTLLIGLGVALVVAIAGLAVVVARGRRNAEE
jgi:hypothetical protein